MQESVWEKEYRNPKLVTRDDKPQSFFLKFLKSLKNDFRLDLEGLKVLDLGSGTGRNANYLAKKGAEVVGMEISETANRLAKNRAKELGVKVEYLQKSIGSEFSFKDESFDLVIDITSSNSLNEKEREIYLKETARVLIKDGVFFVRALCKDGDKNAKFLLKNNPGCEMDTYLMPETGLTERVFSKDGFINIYSQFFKILDLNKTESYSTIGGRVFKRKFWLATMEKL